MVEIGNKRNTRENSAPEDEHSEASEEHKVEFDPRNRPTEIRAMCSINMEGRPIIRLRVLGNDDQTLMDSSQDLKDTLALGAYIVETAADILEDVAKLLKDSAWREGIGENFESYVERTETATQRIREQLLASKSS